jgi:hypothetical protein
MMKNRSSPKNTSGLKMFLCWRSIYPVIEQETPEIGFSQFEDAFAVSDECALMGGEPGLDLREGGDFFVGSGAYFGLGAD